MKKVSVFIILVSLFLVLSGMVCHLAQAQGFGLHDTGIGGFKCHNCQRWNRNVPINSSTSCKYCGAALYGEPNNQNKDEYRRQEAEKQAREQQKREEERSRKKRLERERKEREKKERERIAREKMAREERARKEREERKRIEREKAARKKKIRDHEISKYQERIEQLETEKKEKEAMERKERERKAREERERIERERKEKEEKEQIERARAAREKFLKGKKGLIGDMKGISDTGDEYALKGADGTSSLGLKTGKANSLDINAIKAMETDGLAEDVACDTLANIDYFNFLGYQGLKIIEDKIKAEEEFTSKPLEEQEEILQNQLKGITEAIRRLGESRTDVAQYEELGKDLEKAKSRFQVNMANCIISNVAIPKIKNACGNALKKLEDKGIYYGAKRKSLEKAIRVCNLTEKGFKIKNIVSSAISIYQEPKMRRKMCEAIAVTIDVAGPDIFKKIPGIKYGKTAVDTSYEFTVLYQGFKSIKELDKNSEQYLKDLNTLKEKSESIAQKLKDTRIIMEEQEGQRQPVQ